MLTPGAWKKSSFSGGGQGDACVEVAHRHVRIAVRDSKAPARASLRFPPEAFTRFIEALKAQPPPRPTPPPPTTSPPAPPRPPTTAPAAPPSPGRR
ncbi:DUF397 domain-containing protein [Streptomyces collinus]|uniref:DUF397 domain-containing protein n=1 Tax=Streptomyces collinus TaxID=42684 RepID=UPI00363AA812